MPVTVPDPVQATVTGTPSGWLGLGDAEKLRLFNATAPVVEDFALDLRFNGIRLTERSRFRLVKLILMFKGLPVPGPGNILVLRVSADSNLSGSDASEQIAARSASLQAAITATGLSATSRCFRPQHQHQHPDASLSGA